MPSLIEIILSATDQTGPGFASARANLSGLNAALGSYTTAGAGVVQTNQQIAASTQQVAAAATTTQSARVTGTAAYARAELSAAARIQAAGLTGASRVEAQRLSSVARVEAAEKTANARVVTAEIAGDARVEAERVRAANRIELLERRQAAQGPALPRTFAGFTGQGLIEGAGALGIATGVPQVIGQLRQLADQGQDVQVALDRTRSSLGAVLGDQQRANTIFEQATQFADRYKLTQQEMAGAIQASSQIIRTSQQPIENILDVLARLQVLSPEQGLEGAALALRELTSGDTQSLKERFEVTKDAANAMKKEIAGGADAVQVLGRYLDSAGITSGALKANLAGAAGQQREWTKAVEDLGIAINNIAAQGGVRSWATDVVQGTTGIVKNFQDLTREISRSPVIRFLNQLEDRLSRPINAFGLNSGLDTPFINSLPEMRDERDRPTSPAAPVTAQPRIAYSPYANAAIAPAQQIAATAAQPVPVIAPGPRLVGTQQPTVINHYHMPLTVQGSLVHTNDVVDTVRAGIAVADRRSGFTETRGRR